MGLISHTPPSATYQGHVFVVNLEGQGGKCQLCGLEVTLKDAQEGADFGWCPESPEGKAMAAQAAKPQPELEAPAIAVPESWTGTDAEAVGLAVAGAVGGIARERDLALQHLGALVSAYPETSWAASSAALDAAKAFLAEMTPEAPDAQP